MNEAQKASLRRIKVLEIFEEKYNCLNFGKDLKKDEIIKMIRGDLEYIRNPLKYEDL